MESSRDLSWDIQVADYKKDHVGESFESFKSACPIFDDPDDAVDAFCFGIGKASFDKGEDVGLVFSQSPYEFAHRFEPTL